MPTTIELEMRIIIALIGLIAGFVPGIFLGVHLMTRNHFLRTPQHRVVPPRPRPQARTQVLHYDDEYRY